jgi:dTDP-glucose 4,6-dehydratase
MTAKKFLVTGADGFIGSHLCEHLVAEGHSVRAFAYYNSFGSWGWLDTLAPDIQAEIEVILGDVRDPFVVKSAVDGVDVVLHLAALIGIPYSYVAPQSYIDTNVTGTLNVLEAVKTAGTERLVQTSTSEVYGSALFVPITEEHPLQGQSPYSASKIGADQLALSYYRSFGTPVSVMRPFNTYGPRQSARAVIPTMITQALQGATTLRLGSLTPTRDFNYVKDIARGFAMMGLSDAGLGKVINFGSNFEISIGQVVEAVAAAVGNPLEVKTEQERVRPEHSEVDRLWADATLAKELIGWTPNYGGLDGFERGIAETVAWFADAANLVGYRTDRYVV